MKKLILCAAILVGFPLWLSAQVADYSIGPTDLLEISVWGEDNISRQVIVRSDGFISLPLVGDIKAAEKTPSQLQEDIEKALLAYIKDPRCAVIVIEPRSKRFYIDGQVTRPGQYTLDTDMSLVQVISMAGGFTEWAKRKSIVILRNEGAKQKRFTVDYTKIIKGAIEDLSIRPGDTIIVP
ncbi:MAG: polysaccharide biosynthesis/export family protein [Desulfomonilia bacterium]|nr:polysaccharide biosynthesis/export family protein [Desulfomonilia bacterium]